MLPDLELFNVTQTEFNSESKDSRKKVKVILFDLLKCSFV